MSSSLWFTVLFRATHLPSKNQSKISLRAHGRLFSTTASDGTEEPLFGPNPIGSLMISPNGRYSVQIMRVVNRPQFASKNLNTGTPEENKAAIQGMISHFGTYTADENDKSLTLLVEGSSFPNLQGIKQKWQIENITDDMLTLRLPAATSTNPAAGFVAVEVVWRKVK